MENILEGYSRPQVYGGVKITIIPSTIEVNRSWSERLFSWPWRPKQKTKWIDNIAAPDDGEFFQVGDVFWCNERTAAEYRQAVPN